MEEIHHTHINGQITKTVEDITNLTIGTYSVTVTDSNMCTYSDSFIVSQPIPLSGIINSNDVSCNGIMTEILQLLLLVEPLITF